MLRRHIGLITLISILTLGLFCPCPSEAIVKKLSSTIKYKGTSYCIPVNGKWRRARLLTNGVYANFSLKNLTKSANWAKRCAQLLEPGSASNLSKLPSLANLARAKTSGGASTSSVSGTPPTLPAIALLSTIKDLFWRTGVVDAVAGSTATVGQCSEFLNGLSDGESSGFSGCYLAQNVGYNFQNIVQSGTSLCYLKHMASQALVDSNTVSVVSGSLPGGDIEQVLAPAPSSERIVKVSAGGSYIYIKIFSAADNAARGNQFRYHLWFCNSPNSQPTDYEKTTVKLSGEFIANVVGTGDGSGQFTSTVRAFLTQQDGSIVFDASRDRSANSEFSGSNSSFKSYLVIDGNNVIRSKSYDTFVGFEGRRSYSVSLFSGTSVSNLRLIAGAYKDKKDTPGNDYSAEVEYREPAYLSATGTTYGAMLAEVDIDTDPFYSNPANVTTDTSEFSCNASADVVLSFNLASSDGQAVQQTCEGERLDGMDFCNGDSNVQAAYNNYNTACPH
ncbi:MAG: hypothetical protein K1X79_03240 [Oligoflexia bacterium]|nr:hypothetical protein [Oligoflexia bacterium]